MTGQARTITGDERAFTVVGGDVTLRRGR